MISVILKFRPSSIQCKEGYLYYHIRYNGTVRKVATTHCIFSEEWDSKANRIIVKSSSERLNFLESVKRTIHNDIERIKDIEGNFSASSVPVTVDVILSEFHRQKSGPTMFDYLQLIVSRYSRQGKFRTSETYAATLSSFRKFMGNVDIALEDLDSELLETYESHLRQHHLASNTISFYMKHLRAVYNRAVEDGHVVDKHPFRRVTTSIEKTSKRALSLKDIRRIKAMDLNYSPAKCFARDMFLFSFYTRGMSFVDIAYLRKKDLSGGILSYRRKKTNQYLSMLWESCMQDILKMYGADKSSPYLFSIIKDVSANHRKQYLNAMCLINRHLKAIGEDLGLNLPLTLYCARHSWASIARDEGIPLSVISEGMGHDSERTTQIYLASLKTEVIDKANRKILKLL